MSSSKIHCVATLKELQIQKALGIDAVMCSRCSDRGKYAYIGPHDTWVHKCELCEMGWVHILAAWEDRLNRSFIGSPSRCTGHELYIGAERPTVLCDACWRLWFAAPRKPENLIQNREDGD